MTIHFPTRGGAGLLAGLALAVAPLLGGHIAGAHAAHTPAAVASPHAQPSLSVRAQTTLNRLEPASGTYFGASLNWADDSAASYDQRLGRQAALFVQFFNFPFADGDLATLDDLIDQCQAQGAMALITLEPNAGLDAVTPQLAADLGDRLAEYNARGVPLFVRFAHEMNGAWYPWSQQPAKYVQAFRTVADAVHSRAPQSAMVWAPNYGGGYPFHGGQYEAQPGTPDFAALDTNRDGKLDQHDDMYAPYYPGDDAVDWVGMSLYHWGDRYPWGKNIVPEPGKFIAQLTGNYNGANGDDRDVPDFYKDYAVGHGKPLAIVETAALYNTTVVGDDELQLKQLWWRQVLDPRIARDYPQIKMINWFESRKFESEVNAVVDWRATGSPRVADAFLQDLAARPFLYAGDWPAQLQ